MIINSSFKPAWWLQNPHLQTIWGTAIRRRLDIHIERERVDLPDGDFVDIDWAFPHDKNTKGTPIVLILHGLGGSIESHYATGILKAITDQGWRGAFMHFRGASGTPNRLPRAYHSGDTGDLDYVVNTLLKREPHVMLATLGYSLGGNVLLKWLGETAYNNPVTTSISISVPFVLEKAATRMASGFSRFYQWFLISKLHNDLQQKFEAIGGAPFDLEQLRHYRTFWEFDTHVTAPLHGFKNASDYYVNASSKPYLSKIHVPTLILHALDDPFMTPEVVPVAEELSPQVTLELSECGGHVGFISCDDYHMPEYWLDKRIIDHIKPFLESTGANLSTVYAMPKDIDVE